MSNEGGQFFSTGGNTIGRSPGRSIVAGFIAFALEDGRIAAPDFARRDAREGEHAGTGLDERAFTNDDTHFYLGGAADDDVVSEFDGSGLVDWGTGCVAREAVCD